MKRKTSTPTCGHFAHNRAFCLYMVEKGTHRKPTTRFVLPMGMFIPLKRKDKNDFNPIYGHKWRLPPTYGGLGFKRSKKDLFFV